MNSNDEDMPLTEMHIKLQRMEETWGLVESVAFSPMEMLENIYSFGSPAFSNAEASETYELAVQAGMELQGFAQDTDPSILPRVMRLLECIQESASALVSIARWSGSDRVHPLTQDDLLLRFQRPASLDKEKNSQIVFKFILTWCRRMQIRHRENTVYMEKVYEGNRTRAWLPAVDYAGQDVSTLELLVSFVVTQNHNADVWSLYLTLGIGSIVTHLRTCREAAFPFVRTTRSMIAFADGIYSVYGDCFMYYSDKRFQLPSDLAVCAYHPCRFAPVFMREPRVMEGDPIPRGVPLHPLHEVETPLLDHILNSQGLCGHTRFWVMAMLGRMLYWAKTLDAWQVCLFIKGMAGTGKSTLITLMESIYTPSDVFRMPNNVQDTFGLMNLTPDKFIWTAGEVKADFNLVSCETSGLISDGVTCK